MSIFPVGLTQRYFRSLWGEVCWGGAISRGTAPPRQCFSGTAA